MLLEAHQEQIRAANATLPTRQREALALRELEELSYDEIAEIMGMNRNSVAQLLSRARIGLRDGLRRSALGSIASASPDCERALPLLALRQDGALDHDAAWLAQHLSDCSVCPARVAAMEEAGGVYRLWLPLVPAVWLRGEIASAAEHIGAASSRLATPSRRARRLAAGCTAVVLVLLPAALVPADAAEAPATTPPVAAQIRGWSTPAPFRAVAAPATVTASATATADPAPPTPHPRETEPGVPRHVKQPPARLHGGPPAAELHAGAPVRRRAAPRAAQSAARAARLAGRRAGQPAAGRRRPARAGRRRAQRGLPVPRDPGTTRSPTLRGPAVRARRLGAGAAVLPAVPTRRPAAAARRLSRTAVPAPTSASDLPAAAARTGSPA